MKEIKLPSNQTIAFSLKPEDLDWEKIAQAGEYPLDDGKSLPFKNTFDKSSLRDLEVARNNGGKVLYATTSIEKQVEKILLKFFMGHLKVSDLRSHLFENEILQSSALTLSAKRLLLDRVINDAGLLQGKKKTKYQAAIKKVIQWRNMFAHGNFIHHNIDGVIVSYYSGGPQIESLTDGFWESLESTYRLCFDLLSEASSNLESLTDAGRRTGAVETDI